MKPALYSLRITTPLLPHVVGLETDTGGTYAAALAAALIFVFRTGRL